MGMNCRAKCWKIAVLAVVGIAVLGLVVMALWNWLMPTLFFGMKEITYWQALGVLVLAKILFGGFRCHGWHGRCHSHRWEQMTPEEREKFQAGIRGCCSGKHKQEAAPAKE